MRAIYTAATGMNAQQFNIDAIAQDIANIGTTAYDRTIPQFKDLIYQNRSVAGNSSSNASTTIPVGNQIGLGAQVVANKRIISQGPLEETGGEFDLAIDGRGYFVVDLPSGIQGYTRDGNFAINENREIVTSEGYLVSPGVTIPDDAVSVYINNNGEVIVRVDGQVDSQNVGQLDLAQFANEGGLEAKGNNIYLETFASGVATLGVAAEDGYGKIIQGYREGSNVDAVSEMVELIKAQNYYDLNLQTVQTADEIMQSQNRIGS